MKLLTTFILLAVILFGCKKFDHKNSEVEIPSCELCSWADSLEGEYAGHYDYSISGMVQFETTDSLHFTVQHIYLNKGPLDDSTRMFFEVTRTGGSSTSDNVSIWVADDSLNLFRNTGFQNLKMNKDSISMSDIDIQSAFGGGSVAVRRNGTFYRQ